jgi:hypothetical protein
MVWGLPSWVGQERWNGRWFEFQHLSKAELRGFTGSEFDEYESFAVVRDPYSRLVSQFLWRQTVSTHYPNSSIRVFESVGALLEAIPRDIDAHWDEHIKSANQNDANFLIHVRPQHHYVFDDKAICLVDHILRFEQLQTDIAPLLEPRGLSAKTFRNNPIRCLEAYFSQQQLDLVADLYGPDFLHFSYPHL